MKRTYQTPQTEYISLSAAEALTVDDTTLGVASNPFGIAVAEDEAIEQAEREAALNGK